jgi:hypothetical protein
MAGFFDTLFGGGAEQEAADKNRALTAQYGTQAQDYLTQGYNTGTGNLNQAIGAYQPLADLGKQYGSATQTALGALGVLDPQSNAIASAKFQNAPGYGQAITAGLDAINRRRAVQGMDASGNADIDAQTFGQNLQNTQYNTWLQNLLSAGQTGVQATGAAATGQAAGYGSLANLAQTYAGNQTGVAGNVLSGNVNANDLEAAGKAAGAKNLLGAGLSLATLALGGPMGGMLGGGLAGSLGGAAIGNAMGGAYGGSAASPLAGLSASDYGTGGNAGGLFATYGLA